MAATREDETRGGSPGRPGLPMVVVQRSDAPLPAVRSRRYLRFVPVIPLVMLLLMTGGVIGLYFQPPGVRFVMGLLGLQPGGGTARPIAVPAPAAPPAVPVLPQRIVGLGRLLPEGEVITLAAPFGAGDARLKRLTVEEGERVHAGQVLGVLDNERQMQSALESAEANLAAREAVLMQVRSTVAASRAEAEAALARAQTVAENAAREFERIEELRRRGAGTEQTLDQRRTQLEEARREVERLRAQLSRYGTGDIERQSDVVVAARNVDTARADLERARADLERAYIRAPRDATVLSITARPGEKPASAGIMNLGDIDHMKAEVEVYQTEIARVTPGAAVEIVAEALPQPLHGQVTRIGLEVGRQTLVDASPAANTDARVVRVTVGLDEASNAIARRFTNLQVIARIRAAAP